MKKESQNINSFYRSNAFCLKKDIKKELNIITFFFSTTYYTFYIVFAEKTYKTQPSLQQKVR